MKYKEQVNTKTGARRWVPIEGSENLVEKINNVPLLGGITKPITKVISGAMAGGEINKNLDTVSGSTMNQQKISLELTKLAQKETDPVKKQRLLERAKSISQGATSQLEGYVNPLMEVMPQDYQNKTTPTGFKENMGAYGADSLAAGLAVGEAYSLPSQVKSVVNTVKKGTSLVKKGVSGVKGKFSEMSQTEKVRKFVQKINPQVKATDANYAQKKNAILEFAKRFDKTGKKSAEEVLTSASNTRDFNIKSINTIFRKTPKVIDSNQFGKKIINGLREVELDPKNPSVKVAVKNIDKMISGVIDESGKIKPTKLYELYGKLGDKAFGSGGVREVKPVYQKIYRIIGEELQTVSKKAKTLISTNDKIRKLLPGVIKTAEKSAKTSNIGKFFGKVRKTGQTVAPVATGYLLLKSLLNKK
ncbi:MAG: hypothetical protein WC479_03050 [Candidatus Izemoplasmatales bacterium]